VSIEELTLRIAALEQAVRELTDKIESTDVAQIAADLQHAVLLAISSYEKSSGIPATRRDLEQITQRIDQLRAQLLG
jgi:phage shock protein A